MTPRVTVLMPAYNAVKFLRQAIESILAQSFADFEVIIIDDGSTDGSADVINSYDDPRINFVRNGSNRGIVFSLNLGLSLARGEYVARMDADDIALADRLLKQVRALDCSPSAALCGCWWEFIDEEGHSLGRARLPSGAAECLAWFYVFGEQPVGHPCVMFRKAQVEAVGGYEEGFLYAEDFRLWTRLAMKKLGMINVPEYLLRYRIHQRQVSNASRELQTRNHDRALADFLSVVLKERVDEADAGLIRSRNFFGERIGSKGVPHLLTLKLRALSCCYAELELSAGTKLRLNLQMVGSLVQVFALGGKTRVGGTRMIWKFSREVARRSFSSRPLSFAFYLICATKVSLTLLRRYHVLPEGGE